MSVSVHPDQDLREGGQKTQLFCDYELGWSLGDVCQACKPRVQQPKNFFYTVKVFLGFNQFV